MKPSKMPYVTLLAVLLLTAHETPALNWAQATKGHQPLLSIKLRARSTVLGPGITLGDVARIVMDDAVQSRRVRSIKIGEAPPPGESTEISLTYIKKCIESSGFGELVEHISGPRNLRVITAHREIDKAFLKENLAHAYSHTEHGMSDV